MITLKPGDESYKEAVPHERSSYAVLRTVRGGCCTWGAGDVSASVGVTRPWGSGLRV